ncbi:MAG TPA: hypothetical protein VK252_01685, partial [Solirubrobacteraceae bacterium]|nr:hypothetical protein [Solirubrobacteraceae bacterium]
MSSMGAVASETVRRTGPLVGARVVPARRVWPSLVEMLACAGALGLLALFMCAGHVHSGGLYYDDWSLLAQARFARGGGLLHDLWLTYGQRPGQVLYYAGLDRALGQDAGARLALAAAALTLEAGCLYALLRHLDIRARHAGAIAALLLVFPFSDSAWLWGVMSLSSLAIAAGLLGTMFALQALQLRGSRALVLHCISLGLYLASVLSYEVFAPAGCLAGLLYVRAVGMRRARARWALDVVAIALALALTRALLPIDVATPSRTQTLAGMVAHAGLIAVRGARLVGAAFLPVGGLDPWVGAGALAAVFAAAACLCLRPHTDRALRADLVRWLGIAGAAALVAAASWALYVPAPQHYAPSAAGTVNRVNTAAAVGLAILLYAGIVLLARMLCRLGRAPSGLAALGIVAAALGLAGAYLGRAESDARAWDAAAADQRRELADVRLALPRLPHGATVYVYGAPATVGPGVPVLNTKLDLSSALLIAYD